MTRYEMFRELYPEDWWKDVPKDFWSFESQPDGVRWTSYFTHHFTYRVGYTAGATLADPAAFAHALNIPDDHSPAIVAFLERHGFMTLQPDGSLTLTKRGEEWYGFTTQHGEQMQWSTSAAWWREHIASIHDAQSYTEMVAKLSEQHARMARQYAELLAIAAVEDHSAESVRLGVLAAAVAIAVANDGTRPSWIPSIAAIRETLASLFRVAEAIGLDPKREFAAIARMLNGEAAGVIGDFAGCE